MVLDEPDDVKAVCHDPRLREPFPDDATVGAAQVDADDAHLFTALQTGEEGFQVLLAFAGHDIEGLVVAQVAEGGGEVLVWDEQAALFAKDLKMPSLALVAAFALLPQRGDIDAILPAMPLMDNQVGTRGSRRAVRNVKDSRGDLLLK